MPASTTPLTPGCLCIAIRMAIRFFSIGRRSSKRVFKNNRNGVISNGRDPLAFSMVGIVVSVNCTWQLAHQEITPVFPSASLSSELVATRPDTSVSPVRNWITPQQWVGPPMTL